MATHEESRRFRQICAKYNLRYKPNEAGEPTSPTRKRTHAQDHLYELGGQRIGVSVVRPTRRKFNFLKNRLIELGCAMLQEGECEGNFSVAEENVLGVARLLSCVKVNRSFSPEELARIKKRLLGNENDDEQK